MILPNDLPILPFRSPAAWEAWLEKHHASSPGVWMKLAKKSSGTPSIDYPQALDLALCFGWIDGLKKSIDATCWLQRFTPRRPRSKWSKINCGKVLALEKAGLMRARGLAEVTAAKADGRWEAAYAGQKTMEVPADLIAALAKKPKARKLFEVLSSRNRFAILYRIHDAKRPETRAARVKHYVEMLADGTTPY